MLIFKIRCNEKTMEQSGVTGSLEQWNTTREHDRWNALFFFDNTVNSEHFRMFCTSIH